MFLNSVQVDPNKTWKGVWRWYSEEILHCTTHEFLQYGITLEEITQLARCNGLHTMTFKPKDDDPLLHEKIVDNAVEHDHTEPLYTTGTCCSTNSPLKKQSQQAQQIAWEEEGESGQAPEQPVPNLVNHNTCASYIHAANFELFRIALIATTQIQGFGSIINLSRKVLDQTGDGHFCPIGGYNGEAGKVLLLDTARFKYPPHWVDTELLYESISYKQDNGLPRGFFLMSRKASQTYRETQHPEETRQPRLPTLDVTQVFSDFIANE